MQFVYISNEKFKKILNTPTLVAIRIIFGNSMLNRKGHKDRRTIVLSPKNIDQGLPPKVS